MKSVTITFLLQWKGAERKSALITVFVYALQSAGCDKIKVKRSVFSKIYSCQSIQRRCSPWQVRSVVVDIGREEQSLDNTKLMTIGTSSDKAPCTGPNSKSVQMMHQQSAKMDFKSAECCLGFYFKVAHCGGSGLRL